MLGCEGGRGASATRLAGSTELRVSARHVSRETGAHLQSPRVQKGNLFTVCGLSRAAQNATGIEPGKRLAETHYFHFLIFFLLVLAHTPHRPHSSPCVVSASSVWRL